ncbi:ATP-binding protein [Amycolatopsis sp. 195334CR]|uniref:ATP-binding protein n=1 Tax=Amycolatopsis sp. 195334CR TaxID=2814588 RepID=UPI001A8F2CA2|nr:ATP-binding protein [Amycolatopsis sp. 195334CR]MBN6042020.1 ATP-binding protein [Amycolatopsis sp. 195334CR]
MSEQPPVRLRAARGPFGQALIAALVTAVVVSGLWWWVAAVVPTGAHGPVLTIAAITGVLLCAAAFAAVHHHGELQRARAEVHRARGATDAHEAELARLVDQTVPAAVSLLRDGASVDTVFAEIPRPPGENHARLLRSVIYEISVGERRRAAATAACANAAGRVQALATSMLANIRELQNRCSEEFLGDLMVLDHSTAQAGRLADSIAVLTGARSGRRWTKPIVMESVLRGAMGRIGAYQRIRIHSTSAAAVAGYAAEDVMHALAELMDNGTRFSAPSEEVHIYVEDLHNGVVVTVEDGGLGMKPQALTRAEAAVSTTTPLDLTTLTGTRLGLAVVGCLARKHELHVFFRPSSRGGTGVVLRIPSRLITQIRHEPFELTPRHQAPRELPEPATVGAPALEQAESALPKRPRGQTLAASRPSPAPRGDMPRPRPDSGSRFGAYQAGRTRKETGEDR